ncbi:MAG: nicotinate-nucleotide--dimethylbenzimidazole phosphoribosyltransferase [Desulfobacteraceae bacterium]|nr:nicotinate-nucleotide--dimethylbenzimidazole phosphoribosyltransferase [Desulfobacteraceae bacterium]
MKKLVLTGLKRLSMDEAPLPEPGQGEKLLRVLFCAVCRTDAKMWSQGHRDLVFPRVMGHEVVVEDDRGKRFVIWPGTSCGRCSHCAAGRENLCESMTIMGFHNDGGFAEYVVAPEASLVPVPDGLSSWIACFAEPVGCVLNAVSKLDLESGQRVLIYGGGTVGLIAALVCKDMGGEVCVIEKSESKIDRLTPFLEQTGIACMKDTHDSEFDCVINACPDPVAFSLGVVKAGKGARYAFFSGLSKNETMETNLVNLLHYKEVSLTGAYGLTRQNMADALAGMARYHDTLAMLKEETIPLAGVGAVMPGVLSGEALKYVVDLSMDDPVEVPPMPAGSTVTLAGDSVPASSPDPGKPLWQAVSDRVRPVDQALRAAAQTKIDNKTKPLGALGGIEDLALQMSLIQKTLSPSVKKKALFVFAGDHGITEEGVSAYPSEVTGQMVENFLAGGAAINVLCRHHDIEIKIVDMGVKADFKDHPDLIRKKVARGTRNFALEPAMTEQQVTRALDSGMEVFLASHETGKIDVVGLGEMGIGNTTPASAIISCVTGITPAEATGRGTGVDDHGLKHKAEVIERALEFQKADPKNGVEILRKIGGFEIAAITGAVIAAASTGTAVVLDGVISTAAGLVASVINPDVNGYLISGHKSVEKAQVAALRFMDLSPMIDFRMRLGEGTGAALTMDIADAACKIMNEMASFDDAGVSKKS